MRILVTALNGLTLRNALYTGLLGHLSKRAQVVLLARKRSGISAADVSAIAHGVELQLVDDIKPEWGSLSRGTQRLISLIRRGFWNKIENETLRLKQQHGLAARRAPTLKNGLVDGLARLANWDPIEGNLFHRIDREIATHPESAQWTRWLEAHRIDRVYLPSFLFHEELLLASIARYRRLPAVLGILSWDNLSSKGHIPGTFDRYLVWSPRMRQELLTYYPSIDPSDVTQTGSLHFDIHAQVRWHRSREEFLGRWKLDPARPLLFYGASSPNHVPEEPLVARTIFDDCQSGELGRHGFQMLVRLHPQDDGARFGRVFEGCSGVAIDHPNLHGSIRDWSPVPEDIFNLVNGIRHSEIVLTFGSTITLDGMAHEKPVVSVDWVPGRDRTNPCPGMLNYDYTHFLPVMESGATPRAKSRAEIVAAIDECARSPRLHSEQRTALVRDLCGPIDGLAHERIAESLLGTLRAHPRSFMGMATRKRRRLEEAKECR